MEANKIAIGLARDLVIVDARIKEVTKSRIVAVIEEIVVDRTKNNRHEMIPLIAET